MNGPQKRQCPSCKRTKNLTDANWNKIEDIPFAYSYYCRLCMIEIEKRIENLNGTGQS
jgi:glutaredoxin